MAACGQAEAFRHALADGFEVGLVKPIDTERLMRLLEDAASARPLDAPRGEG
jgi:hypothetical protein